MIRRNKQYVLEGNKVIESIRIQQFALNDSKLDGEVRISNVRNAEVVSTYKSRLEITKTPLCIQQACANENPKMQALQHLQRRSSLRSLLPLLLLLAFLVLLHFTGN